MARPQKKGLEYFAMDVDFFNDIKVRKLIRYQGGKALTVYICLLCIIYKNGYYMRWDEELPFIISEQTGYDEVFIQETLKSCLVVGLFDKGLWKKGFLTSRGIQLRYLSATSRRTNAIDAQLSLVSVTKTVVSATETPINVTETGVIAAETPVIAAESTQRKENKIKEKERVREKAAGASFLPPSLDDVSLFVKSEGLTIDAARFFNFYESNGWMTGRTKMRDWRAALRAWAAREDEGKRRQAAKSAHEPVLYPHTVKIPTEEERRAEKAAKEEKERRDTIAMCRMAIEQPGSRYEKIVQTWSRNGRLARCGVRIGVDTDTGRVLSVEC